MHSNMLVAGAYPKAVGTQVSGYMLKELIAAMQTEVISEDRESDCGSKMFIHKKITTKNLKDNMYRYIKGNDGKLVQLTKDNSNEYIDKVVEMRSPMYCIGVGKNKCLCSRCAGDFYYKLGKLDIGLSTGSLAGTLSNLNMKKFHDNVVKMHNININDILV